MINRIRLTGGGATSTTALRAAGDPLGPASLVPQVAGGAAGQPSRVVVIVGNDVVTGSRVSARRSPWPR
jgi:hypothetical protein